MSCNHLNFGKTRRDFFSRFAFGLGGVALAKLVNGPVVRTVPSSGRWLD